MTSKLTERRKPDASERKRGAEIVFVRRDDADREHIILACRCYESWEQWGASRDILSDNVRAVEAWRHGARGG